VRQGVHTATSMLQNLGACSTSEHGGCGPWSSKFPVQGGMVVEQLSSCSN
jgi:hypothetical protein